MDLLTLSCIGTVAVVAAGVTVYINRQRRRTIEAMERSREKRREPVVTSEFKRGNEAAEIAKRVAPRPSTATSAANRRPSTPGTVQSFRSSDTDAQRRRDDLEDDRRRQNDTLLMAAVIASEPSYSEPRCSPSYDDSSSRNSSSSHCSGGWGGGSSDSSSSSSSDSGSCSSGCD